jgi:mercuric ion transport protein
MSKERSMASVELLYFPDCPNVPAAREQLRRACDAAGVPAVWSEVDVTSESSPPHVRGYGSPTVLVDGEDVTGAAAIEGLSCRIYVGSDVRGVPPLDAIIKALRASPPSPSRGKAATFAVVPGALLSVLPVVSCPSCWPAYAGVLGSLGVPFLMDASWLLPLTAGALLLALVGLGYRARRRRGFGPLLLGVAAAAAILLGKFALELDAAVYAGAALLVVASVLNTWPKRAPARDACGCAPETARQ